MRLITSIFIIICLTITLGIAVWYYDSLRNFISRHLPAKYYADAKFGFPKKHGLKEQCAENKLLLQLAQLNVVSPEHIILLLTNKNLRTTCQDVCEVLLGINSTISMNVSLPPDNLYLRLFDGLDYFNSLICLQNTNSRRNHLTNYHDCIQELREDLIECEGPADWFEKTNEAVVCAYYNDIVDCQYTKAAMICGLKPAQMLRTLSIEIMQTVVMFKCRVSRSLPYIDDPMTSVAAGRSSSIRHFSLK